MLIGLLLARASSCLAPPTRRFGAPAMLALDRAAVTERVEVRALVVPAKRTGEFLKRLRPHLLNAARTRNVVADGDGTRRLLLARDLPADVCAGLPAAEADWLRAELAGARATLATHAVTFDYAYFTAEEVLKRVLPPGVPAPTAFETAGHVAHLNLRPEHAPYFPPESRLFEAPRR